MPAGYWEHYGLQVQRRAAEGAGAPMEGADRGEAIARAQGGSGAPADPAVRERVEAQTGADLSGVRVHTGADSQRAAASVEARAYTIGHDIHFGSGQYQPGTSEGAHLLAHELAHSAQQGPSGSLPQGKLEVSQPHDPAEAEADAVADAAMSRPSGTAGGGWGSRFQASAPEGRMAPASPIARRGFGTRLARVPIKGNAFGDWDLAQKNSGGGKAGAGYASDIHIQFAPDAKTVDSSEIAFIQNVRVAKSGTTDSLDPRDNFKNRKTDEGFTIDRVDQRKFGFYGYNNDGKASGAPAAGGNTSPGSSPAPLKPAELWDRPQWSEPNSKWDFETAAVAKAGKDTGTVYGAITWGFSVDKDNNLTSHVPAFTSKQSASFDKAVDAWNKQADGPAGKRNHPDQQKFGALK